MDINAIGSIKKNPQAQQSSRLKTEEGAATANVGNLGQQEAAQSSQAVAPPTQTKDSVAISPEAVQPPGQSRELPDLAKAFGSMDPSKQKEANPLAGAA